MVIDPITMSIIASALMGVGKGVGGALEGRRAKKMGKLKAKEQKRQTYADLLNQNLQGQAEIQGQGLDSSRQLGAARTRGLMDTASTVREAFR